MKWYILFSRVATRKLGSALTNLALNKYFQFFANLPFVKTLFEKFSQQEVGVDIEVTSFSGVLTVNWLFDIRRRMVFFFNLKIYFSLTFLHHQVIEFGKYSTCFVYIIRQNILSGWVLQKCLILVSKLRQHTVKINILIHYFKIFSQLKSELNWRSENFVL